MFDLGFGIQQVADMPGTDVPEPGSLALMMSAAGGLAFLRRRRR
jgi:hypothetical protein